MSKDEDEYRRRRRYVDRMYERFAMGYITHNKYMEILEDSYDVLDLDEMKQVDEWMAARKKAEIDRKMKAQLEKERTRKEDDKALAYFLWILALIGAIIFLWTKKH